MAKNNVWYVLASIKFKVLQFKFGTFYYLNFTFFKPKNKPTKSSKLYAGKIVIKKLQGIPSKYIT